MTPGQGVGRKGVRCVGCVCVGGGDDSTGQKDEEYAKPSQRASIDNLRL